MRSIYRKLLSLFIDDGVFALGIVAWLAAIWIGVDLLELSGTVAAVLLFVGLAALLVETTLRAGRRR